MVAAGVALVVVGCVVGGETETLSVKLPEFLSSVTNISECWDSAISDPKYNTRRAEGQSTNAR